MLKRQQRIGGKRRPRENGLDEATEIFREKLDYCPPTREEEAALCRLARRGDAAARKQLIENCIPWAIKLAMHYRNCGLPADDLVQLAMVGLCRAVDRLDPKLGRLTTYAAYYVRKEILAALSDQRSVIRVPRWHQCFREGESSARRASTREQALRAMYVESLNGNCYKSNPKSANDPALFAYSNEAAGLEEKESLELLRRAMAKMPSEERKLLQERYFRRRSLRDLGKEHGVSGEMIRQRCRLALALLKVFLGE